MSYQAALLAGGLLLMGLGSSLPAGSKAGPPRADSIQVEAVGADPITAPSGASVTLRFRVANPTDTARTVALQLDLPERWRTLTPLQSLSLDPGQSRLQLISVAVPGGAPAGTERARLRAQAEEPPRLEGAATIAVRVPVVRDARLAVEDVPRRVSAGRSYEATVRVVNRGNEAVRYTLDTDVTPDASVRLVPRSDSLGPGEQQRVRATVETNSVDEALEQRLQVRGRFEPWDTTLTTRSRTELVPRGAEDGLLTGPRYPGTLRLNGFGAGGAQAGQVAFEGSSEFGEDGARSLDLLLRGPNQSGTARFGRRSTYRATYSTPSWTIRAGDHTFDRTRLAGRGTFGVGGELQYRGDWWRVGGYGLQSRFGQSGQQGAVYAGSEIGSRVQVLGNVVHNSGELEEGTLGTLRSTVVPWKEAELQVEGGYGRGDGEEGGAYRAELSGQLPRVEYQARRTRITAGFPGTFNDTRRTSASLSIRPTGSFSLNGNVQRSVRDQATDRPFTSTVVSAGASFRSSIGAVNWSLQTRGSLDRRPLRNEEGLTVRGGLRTGRFSLSPSVELGQIREEDFMSEQTFRTLGLDASLGLDRQRLRASVDWTQAPFDEGFGRRSRLRATASAQAEIGDRFTMQARGEFRDPGGPQSTETSAQGQLEYRLPFGHTLSAEARYRDLRGDGEVEVQFSYALPVSVPTPSLASQPTLDGRVVDAQTDDPLSGVHVQLGPFQRLTNDEGRFSVPLPDEEAPRLRVSGLGLDQVPLISLPRPIRPEDTAGEFVVPVTEAATLTVEVVLYDFPTTRAALEGEDPEPVGGLVREAVEISDQQETLQRITGPQGRATFDNLRPGSWTIEILGIQVPDDKAPDVDSLKAEVAPGQDTTVTLRVLPTERPQIQFEEGGELGGPPEDEPAPEPEEPSEEEREEDVPGAVSFAVGMGPYVGQVGAFAEWTNALRQAEQVRAAGYTVGVVPRTTDEGLLYRVWAGDYRSPAAALDRLEDRLPAARPDEQFTVQVGAFSDWGRAQQRAAAMRRRLDYVAIQPRKWADETLYRVWVGGFEDRAAAEQQRALLEEDVPLAYVVEAKTKGKYAVQIGAFAEAERARQQVSEIRQTGEPAYVQFTSGAEDAPYKALVGSIP